MRRTSLAVTLVAVLGLALAAPVGAREFGTIYSEGEAYRTFGNPARVDPGTGTDPIIAFTNFDQGGVAQFPPGPGSHGGRWQVWMATWVDPGDAHLLTDFDDIIALVNAGEITLVRMPGADFRCPILPNVE
ncbi:MAG TPA: hypothetical protein VJ839_01650 [Candidatus Limnocylindria bacterium]|nr:hypothetical protein [Candidatus Limnocylindria bacterium]